MTRIADKFLKLKAANEKAFIPFIMAGDPDLETTVRLVPELDKAGAHIVELGIPFSDPVADGPTIQRAALRALRHRYAMPDYFEAVRAVREASGIPLLLFSYYNPIYQHGLEQTARDASRSGVDGILVTDITPEEGGPYCEAMHGHGLDTVFLAAPTSSSRRIRAIAGCSRGFVYVVSRTGVTGARQELSDSIKPTVERVRAETDLPVAVGFGISGPEQVRAVWEFADGAVVGSAIVSVMEQAGDARSLPSRVGAFCRSLLQVR